MSNLNSSSIKRRLDPVKTTIVGGLVFLVPVVILVVVFGKAFELMMRVAKPLDKWITVDTIGGVALANVLAVSAILLCCFIAGLIARSSFAKRTVHSLEGALLMAIPGYALIKGLTDSMASSDKAAEGFAPVIVKFDDYAQLGFEVERTGYGHVVVYLPGAPNPWSGLVTYVSEDRIQRLDMSVPEAIKNIRELGRGSAEYSEKIHKPKANDES
jgi:uncharacterized membrane protein